MKASMGPQPFGCGRPDIEGFVASVRLASMGPQPFGCGRGMRGVGITNNCMLQWGRNLSVAEGSASGLASVRRRSGFNGAATFRLRKDYVAARFALLLRRFNGAATFRLRKALVRAVLAARLSGLQWGRNLSVAEGSIITNASKN